MDCVTKTPNITSLCQPRPSSVTNRRTWWIFSCINVFHSSFSYVEWRYLLDKDKRFLFTNLASSRIWTTKRNIALYIQEMNWKNALAFFPFLKLPLFHYLYSFSIGSSWPINQASMKSNCEGHTYVRTMCCSWHHAHPQPPFEPTHFSSEHFILKRMVYCQISHLTIDKMSASLILNL